MQAAVPRQMGSSSEKAQPPSSPASHGRGGVAPLEGRLACSLDLGTHEVFGATAFKLPITTREALPLLQPWLIQRKQCIRVWIRPA